LNNAASWEQAISWALREDGKSRGVANFVPNKEEKSVRVEAARYTEEARGRERERERDFFIP
jgi:hypothetical protein